MKSISPNQLQEAHGAITEAVKPFGGLVQAEVPRPSFAKFETWATRENIPNQGGSFLVKPKIMLPGFAGLMAVVLVPRRGQEPQRIVGIVLEDEKRVGVLGGHSTLTPLSQGLLSSAYLNNRAGVLDHPGGRVRAGFGGHAVIAASALANRGNVHDTVHGFNPNSFGTEITKQGLQDIHVGHAVVNVRAGVFALNQVGLEVASHYQLETDDMFGSGLRGDAANIALTLAATISNPDAGKPNLEQAFSEMNR